MKNVNGVRRPTFGRFLRYVAMTSPAQYDRHWKPNWLVCNPCIYKYNYVLKMETFNRDSGAVLNLVSVA